MTEPRPPARARRVAKTILLVVVLPIVLGALIVLVLANTPWGNERVRRFVVSRGNGRLTGELSIGRLRGNLLREATFTDVRVVDSARHPVFSARRVHVRYGLWAALNGRIVLTRIVLDTPAIVLDRQPGRRWNFQTLMKQVVTAKDTTKRSTRPQLGDIMIHHGSLLYRRPWQPDSSLPSDKRDAAIAAALGTSARSRTERVPGGYQRVLTYHDIDAHIPSVELAHDGRPVAVQLASLSMIGEPYRPPVIDVRNLSGTFYASKDSLWWTAGQLQLPASRIGTSGRIGFNKSGLQVSIVGSPLAFADLQWLNPRVPNEGGGSLRYTMHAHGDTTQYAFSDANLRYREATIAGSASMERIAPRGRGSSVVINGADLNVAHLSTTVIHELVPSARLPRHGVIDGHLALAGPPNALRVDADVRFDDAQAGRSHVVARGGVGVTGGLRARDLDVRLAPLQVATLNGVGAHLPIGGTLSGTAHVTGAVREGWSVRGDLTHDDGSARSRLIGSGRYQNIGKRIAADATLQPLSLTTVGRFVPSAQLRGAVTGRVHAEGTTSQLRLRGALRSTSGGGAIDARGTVTLAGSRSRYDLTAVLDALNARAFSRRAPMTSLTGSIAARGSGLSPATANAVIAVDLSASRYDTLTVDRLLARLAVSRGLLRADTLFALAKGVDVRASGTLGLTSERDGTMRFSATIDSLGVLRHWVGSDDTSGVAAPARRQRALLLAARADSVRRAEAVRIERLALGLPPGVSLVVDTLPSIRRDSLGGSLLAAGMLTGNLKRLGVDADVHGRNLVARGNSVASLDAHVASNDVRSPVRSIAFRAAADTIQTGSYGFESVRATGQYANHTVMGSAHVLQDSVVSYAVLGSYARPSNGVQRIGLDSLSAHFDTLTWRLTHPGALQLDHGAITVDSVEFRSSAGGRLFANGSVPKSGTIHLDLSAENVRLGTVLQALQRATDADGLVAMQAKIDGTRADPAIAGRATLRDARYGATDAPDVDVDLRYAARQLGVVATARDSSGRRVLSGTASLPLNLALEKVAGSRKVEGPLVADVLLDSLDLAALPLESHGVQDVRGMTAADVHVRGSWRAVDVRGTAALRSAALTLAATGMRLEDAVADVHLTGDTVRLDSLVARAGGPFRASGTVDVSDRSHPFVHLDAQGEKLRVMNQLRGVVDASANIAAVGPLDSVRVTGDLEVLHGYLALKQFRKDLLRVKAPGELSFFAVYDTTRPAADRARTAAKLAQPKRLGIIADLSVVVDRGNYYRNRPDANTEFFTGDGERLRAHLDTRSGETWAAGFVRIGGGVAIFRARTFEPARGSLTFSRYTNGPGYIEQVGERNVWEPGRGVFPLQLLTGGTSKGPAVGLEAGTLFPIRGRELNGYLTMGRDPLSLLQQSGSSLSGSEAWSGQLSGETGALARRQQAATALGVVFHDIGTGATKEFGLDAFSVSPADVPTELVFGKTGGVRGALVEGGRYVNVDRYVAGQFRLTAGIPGARIAQRFRDVYRLDVGIEPRFLFNAPEDLGITHPTVRTGMFGAFLTRGWSW